nr:Chain G, Gp26 capsid decoration protein [Donellivirus gee]6WKK_H Chain H, Gp26 capsid decoration protein [Donellivirus gee]6WKK_I Chain I, Gp26 capsid decoration protein [Donellivirus gee]6WKK_J Chain J, Gp26 capsid decoration protein [Donellivirus gee]6WKK_K Chain K, Gp26 capsid decoration protein [Donellivirus gee]6WKK_L Chain L, Gp26 capsid decoration protein [Donellivirus gee]6WKK_M Chain M, Gp26 capsid decoration protein [Donellivirus gee]6WKK_N Chain N, Gp26 capsid decoration protei
PYVRLGYEGILNGAHDIDVAGLNGVEQLAGKFATIGANGVKLAGDNGTNAVGLFREDLGDMVNASEKASFYFRGGEYYVNISRTSLTAAGIAAGDEITCDADGKMIKFTGTGKALGVVTHVGEYRAGNMYEKATQGVTDTDTFIGFIMYV